MSEQKLRKDLAAQVAVLEAKLEAMQQAGEQLLTVLPDSEHIAECWGRCWMQLNYAARDEVVAARAAWAAAQKEQEDE